MEKIEQWIDRERGKVLRAKLTSRQVPTWWAAVAFLVGVALGSWWQA